MFGEGYGLKIDSKLNEGTSVTLRIPMTTSVLERDKSA